MILKISNEYVITSKTKRQIFVLLAIIMSLVFTGCRPNLQARYVDGAEANSNMVLYISEIDKLMESKGYDRSDRLSEWSSVDYMRIYELDNCDVLFVGANWYEGKESFFLHIYSSSNKLFEVSNVYPTVALDILSIISNYEITEECLSEFLNSAEYDSESGNYMSELRVDRHGYYELAYITRQEGSVVDESIGNYNSFFMISGLTKTGLSDTQKIVVDVN